MEGCRCNMKMVSSGTPQSGLGQMDIVEGIFSFASGLFGKDPNKTEYDRVRQQTWDSLVELVSQHDTEKTTGTLTRTKLQRFIDTLTQLMSGFKSYTDGMLAKYPDDAEWITPRFHDYYDFMAKIKQDWQNQIALMPADWTGYVQDLFTGSSEPLVSMPFPTTPITDKMPTGAIQQSGFDTTSMLVVGGVIIGAFLLSRKRG